MSLFDILEEKNKSKPLAERVRPEDFQGFFGHESILGPKSVLRKIIDTQQISSMILWGPPGCGKTTLARIISKITKSNFREISAVTSGIAQLKELIAEAKEELKFHGTKTIVFIDEIHRYNKTQQDAMLPHIENGTIILIGATTENPSFQIIPALRSRVNIVRLGSLGQEDIKKIVNKAIEDKSKGLGGLNLYIKEDGHNFIAQYSNGDARTALNLLETAQKVAEIDDSGKRLISLDILKEIIQHGNVFYDRASDQHYDHLSAYQKSLRGSDPDAAIYWLAKMIGGGEDPLSIARRLVVTASEDVSNADPTAFLLAREAFESVKTLGLPEARIPLAQATLYVANAPKSNSAICAIDKALFDIESGKSFAVPMHLKDSHYKDAKTYGHGKGYLYSHNHPEASQQFLPDELKEATYFVPKHQNELPASKKD